MRKQSHKLREIRQLLRHFLQFGVIKIDTPWHFNRKGIKHRLSRAKKALKDPSKYILFFFLRHDNISDGSQISNNIQSSKFPLFPSNGYSKKKIKKRLKRIKLT